jgi:protoporphyrinogen IX oxidase
LLAVFKDNLPLDLTTWLIVALVISMVAAIQLYAKKRKADQEKLTQLQQQADIASSSAN